MFSRDDVIWGMVLPVVWAVVILFVSSLPWRKGRGRIVAPWGMALAIGGAFAMAYSGIAGRPAFPPVEAEGWLAYLALAAAVVAVVATVLWRWGWIGWTLSIVLLAVTVGLILRPPGGTSWAIAAALAVGVIVWWAGMELLAQRRRGAAVPALLIVFSITSAMVLMNSATQQYAKMVGAIVLALVVALALAWLLDISAARGGVLVIAVAVLGLLVAGHFYAEVTWTHLILLAMAPMAAWAGMLPGIRRRKWLAVTVAAVAVAVVLLPVMVPTIAGLRQTFHEQMESTMY